MTSPAAAPGRLSPAGTGARPGDPDLRTLLSAPGSRVILLDGSRDPNSGVTLLVTEPGSAEPQLAVKIATTAAAAEVVAREARLLAELGGQPLPQVGPTLPRHLGTFDADGMLASVSSVVPGVPMRTRYHEFRHLAQPDSVRGDFAVARDWLTALHADTMTETAPIALLDGIAGQIAARWPDDPRTPDLAGRSNCWPRACPRPAPSAPWYTATSGQATCSSATTPSPGWSTGPPPSFPANRSGMSSGSLSATRST